MRFSSRTSFGLSEQNELTVLLNQKKVHGVEVLDLTESNPTRCGFTAMGGPASDGQNWIYDPDPHGSIRAREAICAYYASKGARVHPDDVFLTSGTSEAYSFLFHLLCDAGDEVLCARPAYPLVDHLAAYAEVGVRRSPTETSPGKTKAFVLVNPANPTGRYAGEAGWAEAEHFCGENGAALISDEVFFDFDWQAKARISGVSRGLAPPSGGASLHFTLNGISKMLGLPQMKLAWIVLSGPEKERRAAAERLETIADAFLSVNTPSQNALASWLEKREAFVAEVLQRVKSNFEALREMWGGAPEPEGGWYAILPLPEGASDEGTALRILEQKNVLVHPGYFFDLEENCLVVSLLPQPQRFREGMRCLTGLPARV